MSKSKDLYFHDYVRVTADERGRIIRLSDLHLTLPTVGIFDSPTRCFTANEEWCKIILGAVSLLLELDCWQNAEDENYSGIQQILDFLEGGACLPDMIVEDVRVNGCNIEAYIDGAWVNKGSILPCVTGITAPMQDQIDALQLKDIALQNQITLNDNDIAALQSYDLNLFNQIKDNDTDILNLQNADINLQSQITTNANSISVNTTDITQNYTAIQTLNQYANDHENRITALESAGGSGGANFKSTVYAQYVSTQEANSNTIYAQVLGSVHSHQFTYNNALIMAEFKAKGSGGAGNGYFRISISGQQASTIEAIIKSSTPVSSQVQDVYTGLAGQTLDVSLEFKAGSTTVYITDDQNIQYTIIEWSGIANNIVTFDNGGLAYTLNQINTGTVSSGGNPDNCLLDQNASYGDALAIDVDLGASVQFNGILIDVFSSNFSQTVVTVAVGGNQIQQVLLAGTNNQWLQFELNAGSFPVSGQVISIYVSPNTGQTIADLRMDNVIINYQ